MWRNRVQRLLTERLVQRLLTERLQLFRQLVTARSSRGFSVSGFASTQPSGGSGALRLPFA